MGMGQLRAMDMDMSLLHAGRKGGENLAGIEQTLHVEGAFHPALLRQFPNASLVGADIASKDLDQLRSWSGCVIPRRISRPSVMVTWCGTGCARCSSRTSSG